jgi:YHS domain-containing protein
MKKSILIFAVLINSAMVYAQNKEIFSTEKGAINGYDPIAYFTEGKPVKGDSKFSLKWKEATWYFSSQKNLDAFKAAPEKYAPQYGGYCAYGTSDGHKAPTEHDAWTIVNGKLYLNYNKEVKVAWSKDREALIKKADANWPIVKKLKEE